MATLNGTKGSDVLSGTSGGDTIQGLSGNDTITGGNFASNVLVGGAGNDTLVAGNSGDVLMGGGGKAAAADLSKMSIQQDVTAQVKFETSVADFHNAAGMYTYDATGKVTSTTMLFGDVSGQGVVNGASDVSVALKAGDRIGFFVAPDAANLNDMKAMLADGGSFHLVDVNDGQTANVNSGHQMQLAFQSSDGQWSNVHTQDWTSVFTTNSNDNGDGQVHSHVTVDPVTGQMHVAFEDQWGGGNNNFLDANFSVTIGNANAVLMAHASPGVAHGSNDDTLTGGAGNDTLLGMNGNDVLNGGAGDNVIYGGTGDDHIIAGGGNDTIFGGKGFDTLDFSGANQGVNVDLAHHVASGFGNDKISGIEAVIGSNFADTLSGDKGSNVLDGGAGNDVLHGGKGSDVLIGGAGDDTFTWARTDIGTGIDHVMDFGNGHDVLDLSAVFGGQSGNHANKVQLVDDVAGSHLMAKIGGSFVEVAMLDNVHHMTAADLIKDHMLLV